MAISDQLLRGIQQLTPLPVTVQRLAAALGDQDISPNKIADIVEYDGAVAANILRVANSATYGGRFRTERIRDAVVRLGTTTLLNIVLGEHLKSMKVSAPLYDLTEDELWLHGAAASLAVKAMLREVPPRTTPELATIAALVHDIGKLIMVRYLKADVATILACCDKRKCTFVEAERELFGCDHAEVGAAMARKWSFPDPVTRAIERHHLAPPPEPEPILDTVMLANLAAKSIGVGLGGAGLNIKVDYTGSRKRVGLSVEGFERACAGIPRDTGKVKVIDVSSGSPAQAAGIIVGDTISKVGGSQITSSDDFINKTASQKGKKTVFEIQRNSGGKESTFKITLTPRQNPPTGEGPIGVTITTMEIYYPPIWQRPFYGVYYGFKDALFWGQTIVLGLGSLLGGLFKGQIPQDVSGPVGIFAVTTEAAKSGVLTLISFVGILSVNLAILNILPFPALDGGRLLFIGIEAVTRRRVSYKTEAMIHNIGMVVLLTLLLVITIGDVRRLITFGGIQGFINSIGNGVK